MKPLLSVPTLSALCTLLCFTGASEAGKSHQETFTNTTFKDAANTTADWNTSAGELRLFPFTPVSVGSYDTPGIAGGVVVSGDLAFVADFTSGLQIFNITNPASPTFVGAYDTPGAAYAVAVAGDLAFVADYASGLQIINITNPASPTLVGTYNTPGAAISVAVAGDLAFVADHTSGLQIVNITNPSGPTLVGTYDTPDVATGVAVAGEFAFVADRVSGLQIIDITNPTSPTLLFTQDTPGSAHNVAVAGEFAFVADEGSGLQIVKIATAIAPTPLGAYDTSGFAQKVAVDGDLAFVADQVSGLQIIDITNPASPTLIGNYNTPSNARNVGVAGNLAFVADEISGLHIIDITNPASPTLIGIYDTPAFALGVAVAGDLAFVADAFSGLQIIDITNPATPALVGSFDTPDIAWSVAVAGDLVFVADGSSGLLIIHIANPATPTLVGTYDTSGAAYSVAVEGDLAFVADGFEGLKTINITNPSIPTLVGTYDTSGAAYVVAVEGNLAFVADGFVGLVAIDITNPSIPTLVGSYDTPADAYGVAVAGNLAFVADMASGLQVVRVLEHHFDLDGNIGTSLAVDGGADVIRRVRLSTTQTAGVSFEVSSNGGTNWQSIVPDHEWKTLTASGTDLKWRSTHTVQITGINPRVLNLNLEWLHDYAVIDAVTDIGNDQGRQVRVEWTRSSHDFVGDATQIVEYAVYRQVDPLAVVSPIAPRDLEQLSEAARDNVLMMAAAGWDFITTVPVLVEDTYAIVAPTLKDSTIAEGSHLTTFRVTALTATPGVFFHSPPQSGYSLDNLSPSVPAVFTAAYNTGNGNTLAWSGSPDADFQYFRVYRSNNPNFVPSAATLVHSTIATGWVDPDHDGGIVFYKVTAIDFSGNESGPASPGTVTAIGGSHVPKSFAVYPCVPNPFNPTTAIRFDVPAGGGVVTLRVYDVAGRVVATLVDGTQAAGTRTVTWTGRDSNGAPVASGVYFYRFTAPGYSQTHKMVMLK